MPRQRSITPSLLTATVQFLNCLGIGLYIIGIVADERNGLAEGIGGGLLGVVGEGDGLGLGVELVIADAFDEWNVVGKFLTTGFAFLAVVAIDLGLDDDGLLGGDLSGCEGGNSGKGNGEDDGLHFELFLMVSNRSCGRAQ